MSTYPKGSSPLAGRRVTPAEIEASIRRRRGLPPLPTKSGESEAKAWLELLLSRATFEEAARKAGGRDG